MKLIGSHSHGTMSMCVHLSIGQPPRDRLRSALCKLECVSVCGVSAAAFVNEQQSKHKIEWECPRVSIVDNPDQCWMRKIVMIERLNSQHIEAHQGNFDLLNC